MRAGGPCGGVKELRLTCAGSSCGANACTGAWAATEIGLTPPGSPSAAVSCLPPRAVPRADSYSAGATGAAGCATPLMCVE